MLLERRRLTQSVSFQDLPLTFRDGIEIRNVCLHTLLPPVTEPKSGLLAHVQKANLLTPGCGEGKYSVDCKAPSMEKGQIMLKRPKFLDDFLGRGFKCSVREGAAGCVISSWTILD